MVCKIYTVANCDRPILPKFNMSVTKEDVTQARIEVCQERGTSTNQSGLWIVDEFTICAL